jgi:hypothetical protein
MAPRSIRSIFIKIDLRAHARESLRTCYWQIVKKCAFVVPRFPGGFEARCLGSPFQVLQFPGVGAWIPPGKCLGSPVLAPRIPQLRASVPRGFRGAVPRFPLSGASVPPQTMAERLKKGLEDSN